VTGDVHKVCGVIITKCLTLNDLVKTNPNFASRQS
jgi:hypothetical protein